MTVAADIDAAAILVRSALARVNMQLRRRRASKHAYMSTVEGLPYVLTDLGPGFQPSYFATFAELEAAVAALPASAKSAAS